MYLKLTRLNTNSPVRSSSLSMAMTYPEFPSMCGIDWKTGVTTLCRCEHRCPPRRTPQANESSVAIFTLDSVIAHQCQRLLRRRSLRERLLATTNAFIFVNCLTTIIRDMSCLQVMYGTRKFVVAARNADGFACEQGAGNFPPGFCQYALKGRAGDFHLDGARRLLHPLQIFEAHRLHLFQ